MGDQILKSIYKHPKLREIYFQNYLTTYQKSCAKRKQDIDNGSPLENPAYVTYDEDPTVNAILKHLTPPTSNTKKYKLVSKWGLSMFKHTTADEDVDEYVPNSVLYKNQYRHCKCDYFNRYNSIIGND